MDFSQLHEKYWLHSGAIKSFHLDMQNNSAEIDLSVKRKINQHLIVKGRIEEKNLVPCTIRLKFEGLTEASLFDKFPSLGYYINLCSYGKNGEEVGLSFNVHDNASFTYEKDNWVIKAKWMTFKEV